MTAGAAAAGVTPGTLRQVRIPLPDGGFLATSLHLPAGAGPDAPAPALLEALPYRKDDLTASYRPEYLRFRDEYGYAVARVDLRGTGSSPGIALDEYHAQEQADLAVAIAWLADQPWCTGAVGMFGTSWSGFNALQLACERPPALRAVVASYATDDRWTDDVHYMGGALRLLDQVDYPLYMVAMNALPPVPAVFGDDWRAEWRRRVETSPAWLLHWLEQPCDGPYWRHGSVRGRSMAPSRGPAPGGYERIACPTLVVAGWADGYRNNTVRTFRALDDAGTPVHVLAGPWSHRAPATSVPGPGVDHVRVMARWWDRWLRGEQNGADAEPPVTVFVRRYAPPEPDAAVWPGRWEAHDRASLDAVGDVVLPFTAGSLTGARPDADGARHVVRYDAARDVGSAAWNSCAGVLPWGQPLDQREDDARSVCVEWDLPLGTVVLGHPLVRVRVRPDGVQTHVSAKLSLVPVGGGPSLLVGRGLLDLAFRDGDGTTPRACVPGEWVDVDVECEATAFEVTAGHRLRLALAAADWPNTVAPQDVWSRLDVAASSLALPVSAGTPHPAPDLPQPPAADGADAADCADGTDAADGAGADGDSSHVRWQYGYDVLTRTRSADVDHGAGYGASFGARCSEHYVGHVEVDARTGEQTATGTTRFVVAWPRSRVTSTARLLLRVAPDGEVRAEVDLDVDEGDEPFARRRWETRVRRPLH